MNDYTGSYKARIAMVDVCMLILGVGFLIWQDRMMATIIMIAGILVAVAGVILIVNFLIDKEKTAFDWTIMVFGVLVLAGGLLLAVFSGAIVNIAVYLFASLLAIYGLVDIITSITVTRHVGGQWWISMIFGIAALVFGVVIFALKLNGTDTVAVLIGITFIVASLGGIINALQTYFGRRRLVKMFGSNPPPHPGQVPPSKN